MTFQQDLINTFLKINDNYNKTFNNFINNDKLINTLHINDAAIIVNNLTNYSKLMVEINNILSDINNEKVEYVNNREEMISLELERKMLPIMVLYRQILEIKYNNE